MRNAEKMYITLPVTESVKITAKHPIFIGYTKKTKSPPKKKKKKNFFEKKMNFLKKKGLSFLRKLFFH